MPPPRPPSRIDGVATPLFGMCWYGDPGDGTSIVAHCGGGGSAKTGVNNLVTVIIAGEDDEIQIKTGDDVGVAIAIVKNPLTNKLRLFVGLGKQVNVYSLPEGELDDEIAVDEMVNAVAVNSMASKLAVGCDSGIIKIFSIKDDKVNALPDYNLEGHDKAVCAVNFSPRENKLVSSAKDGTARVWKGEECLGVLKCDVRDPKGPPPKRQGQILVRGCAFGDLMGNLVYTVASGRRGKAFLAKWVSQNGKEYQCIERSECSPHPVSSMSLSGDAGLVALGATDGTIILWGTERWKALKKFPEVHGLPVTCIAARPYPVPLKGDEKNGAQMHAVSASADSQMAWLTMQRRSSKRKPSDVTFKDIVNSLVKAVFVGWLLYPVANEVFDKCETELQETNLGKAWDCIRDDVFIAPASRPGISIPPY